MSELDQVMERLKLWHAMNVLTREELEQVRTIRAEHAKDEDEVTLRYMKLELEYLKSSRAQANDSVSK